LPFVPAPHDRASPLARPGAHRRRNPPCQSRGKMIGARRPCRRLDRRWTVRDGQAMHSDCDRHPPSGIRERARRPLPIASAHVRSPPRRVSSGCAHHLQQAQGLDTQGSAEALDTGAWPPGCWHGDWPPPIEQASSQPIEVSPRRACPRPVSVTLDRRHPRTAPTTRRDACPRQTLRQSSPPLPPHPGISRTIHGFLAR